MRVIEKQCNVFFIIQCFRKCYRHSTPSRTQWAFNLGHDVLVESHWYVYFLSHESYRYNNRDGHSGKFYHHFWPISASFTNTCKNAEASPESAL
jgi:hypothetical protein